MAKTKTMTTAKIAKNRVSRYTELKQMLDDRRREIAGEVQRRPLQNKGGDVMDEAESAEALIQEHIEIALRQMKSETLNKVNAALARLEQGTYGNCLECGGEISEARLRALPFALRCMTCERVREDAERIRQNMKSGLPGLPYGMDAFDAD